jgi:hypothetical protein
MKRHLTGVIAGSIVFFTALTAGAAEIAGGFVIGEPTGFSLRIDRFPVLGFGWALSHDWMYVNCDYWLINKPIPNAAPVYWYFGIGGALGAGNAGFLGCRFPIGLQAVFNRRLEFFGELAPVLGLIPDVGLFANGGIGFRYIF